MVSVRASWMTTDDRSLVTRQRHGNEHAVADERGYLILSRLNRLRMASAMALR